MKISQLQSNEYGQFYANYLAQVSDEYTLVEVLEIAGYTELLENYPDGKASIIMREKIVRPLLTIQQYALSQIRNGNNAPLNEVYEKLVTRSLFGNTNASRNSA